MPFESVPKSFTVIGRSGVKECPSGLLKSSFIVVRFMPNGIFFVNHQKQNVISKFNVRNFSILKHNKKHQIE